MRALIETFVTVRMNRVVLFWVLFCFVLLMTEGREWVKWI